MLRLQALSSLRALRGAPAASGQWRSLAGQAAPADAAEGPALPPCDFTPPAYTGPSKEEVLALRKAHLNPGAPGRAFTAF